MHAKLKKKADNFKIDFNNSQNESLFFHTELQQYNNSKLAAIA